MFQNFKNSFDFFIRQNTRFSRKNYVPSKREVEQSAIENLWMLDILKKYLPVLKCENLAVLDIGSKNWSYVSAQHAFFKNHAKNFTLTGIELDAYRLYPNFYSRFEAAKFYIKDLSGTSYIAGNLLDLNQKFDVIAWFLPFLSEHPHKSWGLPMKYFNPQALFLHAYSLLNPQGVMFIINQGEEEYKIQQNLLQKLGISYTQIGEIQSEFRPYKLKRFATLVTKL